MNAKVAKLLRKRIKEVLDVLSIGRGLYQTIITKQYKDAEGQVVGQRVQVVLDIKCPRALYQRTKRITQGTFHARHKPGYTRHIKPIVTVPQSC